ncbi:MAG: sulfite exporter TauE/SafE family protein [Flavobacterium sp.]|nr:MAG: sulfite exporter TauE/SafE family protein [Flavobacterium sp.]
MEFFGYLASVFIGISLGLIGGGGSILTVPILVYLFKVDAQNATSYSLFIVGSTALVGTYRHYKIGNLKIRAALLFAIPSLASLFLVRNFILPSIPNTLFTLSDFVLTKNLLIMLVFALLMISASVSMIRKRNDSNQAKPTMNVQKLMSIGFAVGIVTGFLGAGGGFLIIPALVFFVGLTMKQAIGTSLFIISINSLLGFAGDVIGGIHLDYRLLFSITVLAIGGMAIGTMLSKKIDGPMLKPIFGWFVLIMGIYVLATELFMT